MFGAEQISDMFGAKQISVYACGCSPGDSLMVGLSANATSCLDSVLVLTHLNNKFFFLVFFFYRKGNANLPPMMVRMREA